LSPQDGLSPCETHRLAAVCMVTRWISLSLSSGAHSRDPLAPPILLPLTFVVGRIERLLMPWRRVQ
jgi:hypothetical protein